MIIKSLKTLTFKDNIGTYHITGRNPYGLYEPGKGFISLDGGLTPYTPAGGKKALQTIIDQGGFTGTVHYINPVGA